MGGAGLLGAEDLFHVRHTLKLDPVLAEAMNAPASA